jgi:hypothetical protein
VTPLRSRTVGGVLRREKAHLVGAALVRVPAYRSARVFGIRQAKGDEQPGPASADEFDLWDLERREAKLRALQRQYLDEALERRVGRRRAGEACQPYRNDPRLQAVTNLRCRIAEQGAELQAAIARKAAIRQTRQPPILHRDCGEVLAIR